MGPPVLKSNKQPKLDSGGRGVDIGLHHPTWTFSLKGIHCMARGKQHLPLCHLSPGVGNAFPSSTRSDSKQPFRFYSAVKINWRFLWIIHSCSRKTSSTIHYRNGMEYLKPYNHVNKILVFDRNSLGYITVQICLYEEGTIV